MSNEPSTEPESTTPERTAATGTAATGTAASGTESELSGFAAHLAANTQDSAGQPWAGRSFQPPQSDYSDDDGSRPTDVAAALQAYVQQDMSFFDMVHVISNSRVLIPLLAVAGDEGYNEHGLKVDKTQELSIVTVEGPDSRKVLPVFTDVGTMGAWNTKARPVPVEFIRAALAAADEDTELIVVNPGDETEFVLRRPMVWAIAKQELDQWLPSFADQEVLDEFVALSNNEPDLVGMQLVNADPSHRLQGPELAVVLALRPGIDQNGLQELLSRLQNRWLDSELIRERVDSMTVKLVTAE